VGILGLGVAVAAATGTQDPAPRFAGGVQLVEVYVTVTDARGEPVTGLRRDDFEVSEDGRVQEVTAFAAGEVPVTVVVGVDRSWSMAGEPLRLATRATQAFLDALGPADRSMVVAIGSDVEVIAPLSSDHAAQRAAVAGLEPWSTTALHDAIVGTLDRLDGESGRRALVVFSDGVDRYSRATAGDVLDRARRSQVMVYPITLGRTRPPLAAELAVLTGGRSFLLRDARALEATFDAIAHELRYQYLLGYAAPEADGVDGRGWRSIRVAVAGDRSGLRVRARDGYYAD